MSIAGFLAGFARGRFWDVGSESLESDSGGCGSAIVFRSDECREGLVDSGLILAGLGKLGGGEISVGEVEDAEVGVFLRDRRVRSNESCVNDDGILGLMDNGRGSG